MIQTIDKKKKSVYYIFRSTDYSIKNNKKKTED